jgi:hypothetical protein
MYQSSESSRNQKFAVLDHVLTKLAFVIIHTFRSSLPSMALELLLSPPISPAELPEALLVVVTNSVRFYLRISSFFLRFQRIIFAAYKK